MKYEIGDKVRVRKDLKPGNEYGEMQYVSSMDKLKGEECVITYIDGRDYQINNSPYWWTDEMLEPVDDLLEYALEKLEMTKEELEDEMNRDKEDVEKAKEIAKLSYEIDTYCKLFNGQCQGCKVKEFKDKYSVSMKCYGVFRYLKEKGEI